MASGKGGEENITVQQTLGKRLRCAEAFLSADGHSFVEMVILTFETATIMVKVDAEYDKLKWVIHTDSVSELSNLPLRRVSVFQDYIGQPVGLVWTLRDRDGAVDAIQFMFSPSAGEKFSIVQLMALGSQIRVFRLEAAMPISDAFV